MPLVSISPEPSIVIPPRLAKRIGDVEAAILNKLHELLEADSEFGVIWKGLKWIYNSYEKWVKVFGGWFGTGKIRRAMKNLEDADLIERQQLSSSSGFHSYYYRIKKESPAMQELLSEIKAEVETERQQLTIARQRRQEMPQKFSAQTANRPASSDRIDLPTSNKSLTDSTPLDVSPHVTPPTPLTGGNAGAIEAVSDRLSVGGKGENKPAEVEATPDRGDKYSGRRRGRAASAEEVATGLGLTLADYREFRERLYHWAKAQSWVRLPDRIAAKHIEDILAGGYSDRLREFREGSPLGISDCQEWQIAIEVFPGAVKLETNPDALEYWVRLSQGRELNRSRTEAVQEVMARLADRQTASGMWEEYKRYIENAKDRVRQAQAMGASGLGEVPAHLLSQGLQKPGIGLEEVAAATAELKGAIAPALPSIEQTSEESSIEPELLPPVTQEELHFGERIYQRSADAEGKEIFTRFMQELEAKVSAQKSGCVKPNPEEQSPSLEWLREKLAASTNRLSRNLILRMAVYWGFFVKNGEIFEPEF